MPLRIDEKWYSPEKLPQLSLIEESLQKLQRIWLLRLVFPKQLEEIFDRASQPERTALFHLLILLSTFLYESFLLMDYYALRQSFTICLIVRLGIVLPVTLLCCLAVKHTRSWLYESLIFIPGLVASAGLLYLYRDSLRHIAEGQLAATVLLVGSYGMLRPRFRFACLFAPVWALGDFFYLSQSSIVPFSMAVSYTSLVLAALGVSLLSNYWMERSERTGVLLLLRNSHRNLELERVNTELVHISLIDSLTGIPNRRFFDAEYRNAWMFALLNKKPMAVLMIDLDHFKKVNDQHGHSYGDLVLTQCAKIIRETLRGEYDKIARYGGEEFVAFLPNRSIHSAIGIANRLCDAVRRSGFPPPGDGSKVGITISIGVASHTPASGSNETELLRAADDALYIAKNNGRDRVYPVT